MLMQLFWSYWNLKGPSAPWLGSWEIAVTSRPLNRSVSCYRAPWKLSRIAGCSRWHNSGFKKCSDNIIWRHLGINLKLCKYVWIWLHFSFIRESRNPCQASDTFKIELKWFVFISPNEKTPCTSQLAVRGCAQAQIVSCPRYPVDFVEADWTQAWVNGARGSCQLVRPTLMDPCPPLNCLRQSLEAFAAEYQRDSVKGSFLPYRLCSTPRYLFPFQGTFRTALFCRIHQAPAEILENPGKSQRHFCLDPLKLCWKIGSPRAWLQHFEIHPAHR